MVIGDHDGGLGGVIQWPWSWFDGNCESYIQNTMKDAKFFISPILNIQDVVPLIDSSFLPGDIWRKEFIDKGYCNGLEEAKFCYQLVTFLFGSDPTNINYVSKPDRVILYKSSKV